MSFYRSRFITCTRKPKFCDWCGEKLPEGSKAHYMSTLCEGDFFAGYMHLECAAAMQSIRWDGEDGFEPGSWARGRADDKRTQPPQFTEADYGHSKPNIAKEHSPRGNGWEGE